MRGSPQPANLRGSVMRMSYAQNLEDFHLDLLFAG